MLNRNLVLASLLILIVAQFALIFNINKVCATNLWDMQEGMGNDGQIGTKAFNVTESDLKDQDIRLVAARLIKVFLEFLGIILVILILSAGYKWMTSAGNEDKIREAKKQLEAAIIGLIIILAAYSITQLVVCKLTEATTGLIQCIF